jgi:carbamoyltransferase
VHILGISCFFHDAAAALLRDGLLVAAAEEERFSRKKHDYEFPDRAIAYVLAAAGLPAQDLDYVVFFEKPFLKFERILMTSLQMFPRALRPFREAMVTWLLDKLWVSALITERLGVAKDKVLFSEHHLSHAASAFFCSPFDEAALLTLDGVGEWATATAGVGRGTDIRLTREIRFPHSVGLLYSTFTAFLGFEVNEGEYKVMGMAPYGTPRYADEVRKLVRLAPDGSFWLDMDYFAFRWRPRTKPNGWTGVWTRGFPRGWNEWCVVSLPRSASLISRARSWRRRARGGWSTCPTTRTGPGRGAGWRPGRWPRSCAAADPVAGEAARIRRCDVRLRRQTCPRA